MSMQPPPLPAFATVIVEYPGNWALMDWKMSLEANGAPVGCFTFKHPATFTIQAPAPIVRLRAKMSFRIAEMDLVVENGRTYYLYLSYDRFLGTISFMKINR